MNKPDTSREAVERLAGVFELPRDVDNILTSRKDAWPVAATLRALLDERDAAQTECLEQARLNGMGAERELKLIAERNSAISEACKQAFQSGRWQGIAQGKDDTIARLRDALTKIASQSTQLPGKMFVEYAREVITRAALGEGGDND